MTVIYLKLLLVIYITNLYLRKISTFYSVQRRNSGTKKRPRLCMRKHYVSGV